SPDKSGDFFLLLRQVRRDVNEETNKWKHLGTHYWRYYRTGNRSNCECCERYITRWDGCRRCDSSCCGKRVIRGMKHNPGTGTKGGRVASRRSCDDKRLSTACNVCDSYSRTGLAGGF